MTSFIILLRVVAPVFLLVAALHLVLGLNADALLGARIPVEVIADPALDSQNRFYGTAFALYGVLLWLCSLDVSKYATVLRCTLWVFFVAGVARLVSIYLHGLPPPLVLALMATEIAAPPIVLVWLARVRAV